MYASLESQTDLRNRLQLVPPGRINSAASDPNEILTLDDCRQFAKFFAKDFAYHHNRAAANPGLWYAEMVEHCTPGQGELIREMTLELCSELNVLQQYRAEQERLARRARFRRLMHSILDATGLVGAMVFLLVLLPLLFGPQSGDPATTPTDLPGVLSPASFGYPLPDADREGR